MRRIALICWLLCLWSLGIAAQDPLSADAEHFTLVIENQQVRVLRYKLPAKGRSPMHSHADRVAVCVTDAHLRVITPDGKSVDTVRKAGDTRWVPAGSHSVENLGDEPVEIVDIEFKPAKTGK